MVYGRPGDDFALGGEEAFPQRCLRQGVTFPSGSQSGRAGDLDHNLNLLYEACAAYAPGASTEDCIKSAKVIIAGRARFGNAKGSCNVEEICPKTTHWFRFRAPKMRWSMQVRHRRFNGVHQYPGPFERVCRQRITLPPDPTWYEEDQQATFQVTDLLAVSVLLSLAGTLCSTCIQTGPEQRWSSFQHVRLKAGLTTPKVMWDAGLGEVIRKSTYRSVNQCLAAGGTLLCLRSGLHEGMTN
jgi:hypothetical protein